MSGEPPVVAVIVPAFDAARTIVATLASASAQSFTAIEIIVVDDGSGDGTAGLVAQAARADGRIRLIGQANAGPVAARNRAIAASTARFIAPLDADDLWQPTYLAEMLAAMDGSAGAAGFVYALHHVIDACGVIVATPPTPHVRGRALARHLLTNFVGNGSAALFRRAVLDRVGGYDPLAWRWRGAEDYLLQLRIAARAPIGCVPRRLVGYRRLPGSVSADPLAMCRARVAAVRTILGERGGLPPQVLRWASADAARSAAALLALRGDWRGAMALAARAGLADPPAAITDLVRRVRNRWRTGGAGFGLPFAMALTDAEPPPRLDQPLARRLAWFGRHDEGLPGA